MKYRPLIGINADYRASAKSRTPHCYIHSGYFDCILSTNALPVFIPPLVREADLTPIITHHLPLTRFADAFELLAAGHAGKVVLLPQEA